MHTWENILLLNNQWHNFTIKCLVLFNTRCFYYRQDKMFRQLNSTFWRYFLGFIIIRLLRQSIAFLNKAIVHVRHLLPNNIEKREEAHTCSGRGWSLKQCLADYDSASFGPASHRNRRQVGACGLLLTTLPVGNWLRINTLIPIRIWRNRNDTRTFAFLSLNTVNNCRFCEISGSHCGEYKDESLLGYSGV
jgi:hypothetical protein